MEIGLGIALIIGFVLGVHQLFLAIRGRERLSANELRALKKYYEALLGVGLVIKRDEGMAGLEEDETLWQKRIAAWNAEYMVTGIE